MVQALVIWDSDQIHTQDAPPPPPPFLTSGGSTHCVACANGQKPVVSTCTLSSRDSEAAAGSREKAVMVSADVRMSWNMPSRRDVNW